MKRRGAPTPAGSPAAVVHVPVLLDRVTELLRRAGRLGGGGRVVGVECEEPQTTLVSILDRFRLEYAGDAKGADCDVEWPNCRRQSLHVGAENTGDPIGERPSPDRPQAAASTARATPASASSAKRISR